jgi:hypothetical protein
LSACSNRLGDRRIGSSSHDQRDRRRGHDEGVDQREELAVERDRRAAGQAPQDPEALVHPASARLRVDAADLDLVGVLAADPDAECQPAGRELGDRGELAGDRDRVAQREQVQPDVHRQLGLHREQRARADQPVRARADEEADVVAHAQVVDAGVGDPAERCPHPLGIGARQVQRIGEEPDPDAVVSHHHHRLPAVPARR